MIWLTWRQFRLQAFAGLLLMAAVAAVYAATRPALFDLARTTGFTGCVGADACDSAASAFLRLAQNSYFAEFFYGAIILLFLGPALVGLFWGAPLVARELESGTHRLVWNQSVSRTRWLAVKLTVGGLATVALASLASLVITWWASPLDHAGGWMQPSVYGARGLVPVGYAALDYVLGVAVGMLLRRTVAAMAVTLLLAFGAIAAGPVLRPFLVARDTITAPVTAQDIQGIMMSSEDDPAREIVVTARVPVAGAWELENKVVTATGEEYRGPYDEAACGPREPGGPTGCKDWLATQNLRQHVVYLGPDKFWPLQWRELGALLAAAALLAGFCFWWVRRRLG